MRLLFGLNYIVVWARGVARENTKVRYLLEDMRVFISVVELFTGVCWLMFYAFSSSHRFYYMSLFRSLSRKLNIKYKLCWASRIALQTHWTKKWRTNFPVMSNGVIERGKTYCSLLLSALLCILHVRTLTWNIRKTN